MLNNKKIMSVLLIMFMAVSTPIGYATGEFTMPTEYWRGTQIPPIIDGYYEISSPEQLAYLSTYDALRVCSKVRIVKDINLKGKLHTPISGKISEFDGQNYRIKNLCVNEENYAGLFGQISNVGCIIKNVRIVEGYVCGSFYVAPLVAAINGTVKNCSVTGVRVYGDSYVGGLVGCNSAQDWFIDMGKPEVVGIVEECFTDGVNISGTNQVGGIVGKNRGYIKNCYSLSSVTNTSLSDTTDSIGNYYAAATGTIAGNNGEYTIENCYSSEDFSCNLTYEQLKKLGRTNIMAPSGTTINCYHVSDYSSWTDEEGVVLKSYEDFTNGTVLELLNDDNVEPVWTSYGDYPCLIGHTEARETISYDEQFALKLTDIKNCGDRVLITANATVFQLDAPIMILIAVKDNTNSLKGVSTYTIEDTGEIDLYAPIHNNGDVFVEVYIWDTDTMQPYAKKTIMSWKW